MVNYQQGKIYKIYSNIDDSICYVGSTCKEKLCQRMTQHRSEFKKWVEDNKHKKLTSFELFQKFGIENCKIELLLLYPCNLKEELTKKESEYIKLLNCVNRHIPLRNKREHYHDNKESINDKKKETKIHCEHCGSLLRKCDYARHCKTVKHLKTIKSVQHVHQINDLHYAHQ